MTTTLIITLDEPATALDADDPAAHTMDYVARCLRVHGVTVHRVATAAPWEGLEVSTEAQEALADAASLSAVDEPARATCPHCGRKFVARGLPSHERRCSQRPSAAPARDPDPPPTPARPTIPDLGPISRRKFDPDRVREGATKGMAGW